MIENESLHDKPIMDNLSDPNVGIEHQNPNNFDVTKLDPINHENQNQPMVVQLVVQLPGKVLAMENSANIEKSPEEIKFINEFVEWNEKNKREQARLEEIFNVNPINKKESVTNLPRIPRGGDQKTGPMGKATSKLHSKKYQQKNNPSFKKSSSDCSDWPSLLRTGNGQSPSFSSSDFRIGRNPPSAADMPVPSKPRLTRINHDDIDSENIAIEKSQRLPSKKVNNSNNSSETNKQVVDKSVISTDKSNGKTAIPRGGGLFGQHNKKNYYNPYGIFGPKTPKKGWRAVAAVGKFETLCSKVEHGSLDISFNGLQGIAGAANSPNATALIGTVKTGLDVTVLSGTSKADSNIINTAAGCLGHTDSNSFSQNYTGVALEGCSRAASGDARYMLPCAGVAAGPALLAGDAAFLLNQVEGIGNSAAATAVGGAAHAVGMHKTASLIIQDSQPEPTPAPIINQFTKSFES